MSYGWLFRACMRCIGLSRTAISCKVNLRLVKGKSRAYYTVEGVDELACYERGIMTQSTHECMLVCTYRNVFMCVRRSCSPPGDCAPCTIVIADPDGKRSRSCISAWSRACMLVLHCACVVGGSTSCSPRALKVDLHSSRRVSRTPFCRGNSEMSLALALAAEAILPQVNMCL